MPGKYPEISKSSLYIFVKLCTQWISDMLSDINKTHRKAVVHFKRHEADSENFVELATFKGRPCGFAWK